LGCVAMEHVRRQQLVVDADELRHAPVDAADPREDVAQHVVDEAFHRGEGDLHRTLCLAADALRRDRSQCGMKTILAAGAIAALMLLADAARADNFVGGSYARVRPTGGPFEGSDSGYKL